MELARQQGWLRCLAVRKNFLPSGIPHIPIQIEDISRYVSQPDYEEHCVKSVQTIGEILPGSARFARLCTISSNDAEITLNLEKLPVNVVYIKDEKGRLLPIWEKHRIFKVFGTLERQEHEVLLIVDQLLKIQDVYGSLNVLSLLSAAVHPMYYQYKKLK